jgi:predicted ArsR family transcriptional regulator
VSTFEQDVAGIGTLADPVRRALYRYVCSQSEPVSRDQAADAVGVARHQAKFHLDRLAAEGLLETSYARLTGRSGPGAGRSSKLYRRAAREVSVSLPGREYELAGELMAEAITEASDGDAPVREALHRVACERGASMARAALDAPGSGGTVEVAVRALDEHGFEPRVEPAGRAARGERVLLGNCPFHALAQTHTELVCHMNHSLLTGFADTLAPGQLHARLEPGQGRCCVVLDDHERAEAPSPSPEPGRDRVAELERWADLGAVWRVLRRTEHEVVVGLFRCDGGEEVERFTSGDPVLLAFLDGRTSSED